MCVYVCVKMNREGGNGDRPNAWTLAEGHLGRRLQCGPSARPTQHQRLWCYEGSGYLFNMWRCGMITIWYVRCTHAQDGG